MDRTFWNGKSVFLTGHTGFKGSWLSLWLQDLGAHVTGFALTPPTNPSLFDIAHVADGMTSIIADIRNKDAVLEAMTNAQPDIVIHMAAQPLVRYSYSNPIETYETNVMGLTYLLEAVRQTPSVQAVVNVTSDKCYDNQELAVPFTETDPMGGHDPYSSSKGCAELITSAYRNSYGLKLASARAGNVIGGGDWAEDRLVPDILRAIEKGEEVIIRNPKAIRPWQHVLEPLCGYLKLAQALYEQPEEYGQGWNFGPANEDAKPVLWIVQELTHQWGKGAAYHVETDNQTPYEAHYLKLDCSKAQKNLDWAPRWDLQTCLGKIIDWQRAYHSQKDMRDVTRQQIIEYTQH
ncbi:CDP-glucose 4,6-dehydratase [Terasakiella sp. SH-1]|uniref:CDP-glucose 4,6-dehydratase n=1 Tax=Terasakiella sp. SH-1 TaxID=2560057 RepID=UPI001074085E|nr:CDP-glucose 4,6-dehydratase [Terasakiella sp. SH-1]